jgi:Ca-activated chloride channel family protein
MFRTRAALVSVATAALCFALANCASKEHAENDNIVVTGSTIASEHSRDAAPPAAPPPPPMMSQAYRAAPKMALGAMGGGAPYVQIAPGRMAGDINTEKYPDAKPNPVKVAKAEPVSTFSIDVDTASYANVRRFLNDGALPPKDAVRIEEMINYFDYDYALPKDRTRPFAESVALAPSPWAPGKTLMHIAIQGYDYRPVDRPALNLVLLLDTSGSMNEDNKLPLVKKAVRVLVDDLTAKDHVAMVAYAGSAGVVLEPTSGADKGKILGALDKLSAGGSTAGGEASRSPIHWPSRISRRARSTASSKRPTAISTSGSLTRSNSKISFRASATAAFT